MAKSRTASRRVIPAPQVRYRQWLPPAQGRGQPLRRHTMRAGDTVRCLCLQAKGAAAFRLTVVLQASGVLAKRSRFRQQQTVWGA